VIAKERERESVLKENKNIKKKERTIIDIQKNNIGANKQKDMPSLLPTAVSFLIILKSYFPVMNFLAALC
jgi:hypothetical protein